MKNRCYLPNTPNYKYYGARNVTVCDEWLNDPKAFIEWGLANGWEEGLSIDKDILCKKLNIEPKVYSPETCIFIPQAVNTAASTNRTNYGKHPNVRLSEEQVSQIIHLYTSGEQTNMSALARQFGLKSPSSVHKLVQLHKAQSNACVNN